MKKVQRRAIYSKFLNNVVLLNICSTLLCYNVDEKKHAAPGRGHRLHGFSPGNLVSFHIPKMYVLGELVCLHCPCLSERGGVYEGPYKGNVTCPGWVLAWCPELLGEALATLDSELE